MHSFCNGYWAVQIQQTVLVVIAQSSEVHVKQFMRVVMMSMYLPLSNSRGTKSERLSVLLHIALIDLQQYMVVLE